MITVELKLLKEEDLNKKQLRSINPISKNWKKIAMSNILRERYYFRSTSQRVNESIFGYMIRLRVQAAKCNFVDESSQIYEQVLAKMRNASLRERALRTNMSFGDFRNLAIQLDSNEDEERRTNECYRCGKVGHKAFEKICEAKKKFCSFCGVLGHIEEVCIKKPAKRTSAQISSTSTTFEDNRDPREKRIKTDVKEEPLEFDYFELERRRQERLQKEASKCENLKNFHDQKNREILVIKDLNPSPTKNLQRGDLKPRAEVKPESAEVKVTAQNAKTEKSVRFR